jgi:predicted lipoprotein with Yx(FWY)xxD motif
MVMRLAHQISRGILFAILVTGCAGAAGTPTPAPAQENAPATETPAAVEIPPTVAPAGTTSGYQDDYGYGTGSEASPTPPPVVAGNPTVNSALTSLGEVVVDAEGFTLYTLASDTATQSTCGGGCASTWPPLLATAEVVPGASLDADLIGTIARDDGTTQVSYAGHPLYHYSGDHAPGDVNGQGRGGVWFALNPAGEIIR